MEINAESVKLLFGPSARLMSGRFIAKSKSKDDTSRTIFGGIALPDIVGDPIATQLYDADIIIVPKGIWKWSPQEGKGLEDQLKAGVLNSPETWKEKIL